MRSAIKLRQFGIEVIKSSFERKLILNGNALQKVLSVPNKQSSPQRARSELN
jgi:hypothetical protein